MFGSWVDVIRYRRPRLPKTRSGKVKAWATQILPRFPPWDSVGGPEIGLIETGKNSHWYRRFFRFSVGGDKAFGVLIEINGQ